MAAQRRNTLGASFDFLPALRSVVVPVASKSSEENCFKNIADAIKQHDQPLVHIEDDENGTAVRALLQSLTRPRTRQTPPTDPPPSKPP